MKKKNLAQEYAAARLQGRLSGNEVSFSENKVFTEEDIEAAFTAGRESVVKNMPGLKWTDHENVKRFISECTFGEYYIYKEDDNFICFLIGRCKIGGYYTTCGEAKQAANEDYKQRIKQALGV